jgi:hypothetical protein
MKLTTPFLIYIPFALCIPAPAPTATLKERATATCNVGDLSGADCLARPTSIDNELVWRANFLDFLFPYCVRFDNQWVKADTLNGTCFIQVSKLLDPNACLSKCTPLKAISSMRLMVFRGYWASYLPTSVICRAVSKTRIVVEDFRYFLGLSVVYYQLLV